MTETKVIDETEMTEFIAKFEKLSKEQKEQIKNEINLLSSCPSSSQ